MTATADRFSATVLCPCGRWEWRDIDVSTGLSARERTCPKCRKAWLIVHRYGELVARPQLMGRDVGSFRQALRRTSLTELEVGMLVLMAQSIREAR